MSRDKPFEMHKNTQSSSIKRQPHQQMRNKTFFPAEGIKQGDMARSGKPSTIKRSAAFTSANKYNMPNYLTHPYIYIQRIFMHGKYKQMVHPDVFVDFEYLKNSFRNNKNLISEELYDSLRRMTKEERYQFYSRYIEMNEQLFETFQKIADALKYRGMIDLPDIVSHQKPKVPKNELFQIAKGLLNSNEEISLPGLIQFLTRIGYAKDSVDKDAHQLFYNIIVGDNPIKIAQKTALNLIPFRALIYNISRYLKKEYRLRGIFTLNSSSQRNKIIQDSIEPFVGENWKVFKQRLKEQQEMEKPETSPDRDELIRLKRIYSKYLYHKRFRFVLSDVRQIIQEYTYDINKVKADIELISHFFLGLFKEFDTDEFSLEQAVNYIVLKNVPQVYVDQYISFMRKLLQFKEVPITKEKFEFPQQSHTEATIITKNDVEGFVNHYSRKRQKDLNIFKDFVLKLKDFEKEFINSVKLNHFECWKWNMVGEWLVKKLTRMDKLILKELGWKQYKDFLRPLPVEVVEVQDVVEDKTEENLEQAIKNIDQVVTQFSKGMKK